MKDLARVRRSTQLSTLLVSCSYQHVYAIIEVLKYNIAVEATTLNERCRRLRPQDKFIRDNISSQDVLIVSIGGNDIALAPTPCTICSVAGLLCLPTGCLESGRSFGAVPVSCYLLLILATVTLTL